MAFVPFTRQLDAKDCGPACLRMVASFHGKKFSIQYLRDRCFITRGGVSLLGISDAAEAIGFKTLGAKLTWEQLSREAPLPCIVHWNQNHFVVVVKTGKRRVLIADPALGLVNYSVKEFKKNWISSTKEGQEVGLCLLLEPTPEFYSIEGDIHKRNSFRFLFKYFRPHRRFYLQLVLGMLVGSAILLILPFLTQAVVDIGINNQDIGFIYLVLIAQLVLIAGRTSIEFIRSWILLHMSTRINISLISDYLIKLMRLPARFFDSKMTGDILQRIGDHSRIESFLTQSTLSIVFSIFNLFIFSAVLAIYNLSILGIFLFGSLLYIGWIVLFLRKRRELDQRRFIQLSDNQNSIIQLVSGMQEIKLNNCEKQKRWEWEAIQAKIFRIRVKSLSLLQYQQVGSVVINESKNVIIAFLAAKAVIDGQMTLGVMFAVQFIIGQMNGPIDQLVGFFHSTQDAKISLERLSEVHDYPVERTPTDILMSTLPERLTYSIHNLVFQYEGPNSPKVINDISIQIPENKTTAIVGVSGSGKTTLLKLMLGFYPPLTGEIKLGDVALEMIDSHIYREHCGVVMQDGYVFSDTIARNIALGDENIDTGRLAEAARMSNVTEFIRDFPLGFSTRVGAEGHGLSQGQKQRILIARAIYKDPRIIFFDEATNSLDANNEKFILENLNSFFKGRTVVVVAHRLSTVRNADQIIVLEKGKVIEQGTHEQLIKLASAYYNLVRNAIGVGNMKPADPNIELRQDEIQEILGVVPPWVIRWGSLTLAIVFVGLIIGTIWFKYPDRITSQLTLTSSNPPVVMNARQNGRIELLAIADTSKVKKGQLLAVLESSASISDILEVDSLMVHCRNLMASPDSIGFFNFPTRDYQFGEWQSSLAAFSKARKDLNDFNSQRSNQARIQSLMKQQKDYKLLYDRQYRQRQIKSEEMDIQEKQYQRLVALRDSNTISLKEFESGASIYLSAKYGLESARSILSQTQIQIDQLDHEILSIEKDYLEVRDQKSNLLIQSFDQLAGTVSNWKLNYAFVAPIDGIITFTRVWSQNQYVKEGDRVITIVSGEPGPVIGKLLLPLRGAGKVKAGQKVIVRIDKYPYMEYGSLQGKVESISMVSDQEFYSVEISFPDGLKTTYSKNLPFNQGMSGQAEIITEELSLLVRIVNPLRSILKRNAIFKS